jgi:predicted porin
MNKQLIAVGTALALAAPLVVQAGVEVYGDARVSVDFATNNDNGTGTGSCNYDSGTNTNDPTVSCQKSKMSVSSNASFIGFKGDEDLGDGMSALWQFEQGVDFDSGNWSGDKRPTFVGIGGGFGNVMAGRFDTPYMSATDKYDIFIDTKADYNAIMGATITSLGNAALFDQRVSNTLVYATPDLGGLKAQLAWVMADAISGSDTLPITKSAEKKGAFSFSANYDNGPASLAAAYQLDQKVGLGGVAGTDAIAWKVGGSYTIRDVTTLAVIYENVDLGGNAKDRNAFYVGASHKLGNTTLKLAYANADKCAGTGCDKTGATQISAGITQSMTRNTELYALYTQVSNDNGANYGLAYGPANAVTGKDESVFSFGINHKFSSK